MVEEDRGLWRRWGRAVLEPAVDGAIRTLYERLDEAVRRRGPVCWVSGRCCHFDRFGHRLYVTGLEIVWVLKEATKRPRQSRDRLRGKATEGKEGGISSRVGGERSKVDGRVRDSERETRALPVLESRGQEWPDVTGPCPFQVEGLCSIHSIRPLGCRVFFCQSGTEQWQRDLYEQTLAELRRLHDRHGLPYQYMEWRTGLGCAIGAGVVHGFPLPTVADTPFSDG